MAEFPVASIIELIGESEQSWEDAVARVVAEASKTVHHIRAVEVLNLTARVENGRVVRYVADCHVAFGVDNRLRAKKMIDQRASQVPQGAGIGAIEASDEGFGRPVPPPTAAPRPAGGDGETGL